MDFPELMHALKSPPVTGWNRKLVWRGFLNSGCGVVLGMVTSLVLNVALVEISVSSFFALYFGGLFLITGAVIGWRVSGTPLPDERSKTRRKIFMGLAALVSVSGLLCCVVQRPSFYLLPRLVKIPTYTLLGVSISFALIFSAIDLINVGFSLCRMSTSRSPVESSIQVSLIVLVAILMGSIFGFMFGLLDVANQISYHVRLSLLREEQLCYPIGGLLGGLAGFANEYLRNQEDGYLQLKRVEFDADI